MSIITIISFLSCVSIVLYIRLNGIDHGIEKFRKPLLIFMIIFFISAGIEIYEIANYHFSGFHKIPTKSNSSLIFT